MYVQPGWTGVGVGKQLLDHAHQRLPRPIRLYTFQANVGARRFYERHGYQAIEFTDGQTMRSVVQTCFTKAEINAAIGA